jgi:hypothetical protein
MKITFILPNIAVGGGTRAVFEFANALQMRGHKVTIIYPRLMEPEKSNWYGLKDRLRRIAYSLVPGRYWPDWFNLKAKLKIVPNLSERFIPDADVVVATWWRTAEWVNTYSSKKGQKFYLVQHYEIWGGPRERVDLTYKLPLKKIVVSSWLKDIMENQLGQRVYGPVVYGVNFEQFFSDGKVFNENRKIGMMYHLYNWKGAVDGIEAFWMAKKKYPGIQLVMFGFSWPGFEVPRNAEFYYRPAQEKLRKIYSSCDIWMCPSWAEGGGMPTMEAMACGCAAVTTDVGSVRDYATPGESILVSVPRKPEALAENLNRLLEDEELLRNISKSGCNKIKEFTWERAAVQLEKAIYQGIAESKGG